MEKTFETPGPRAPLRGERGRSGRRHHQRHGRPWSRSWPTRRGPRSSSSGPPSSAAQPGAARRGGQGPRLHGMRFVRRNAVTVRVELPEGADVDGGDGIGRRRDHRARRRGGPQVGQRRHRHRRRGGGRDGQDGQRQRHPRRGGGRSPGADRVGDLRCSSVAGPPSSRPPRVTWSSAPPATGSRSRRRRATSAWASWRTGHGSSTSRATCGSSHSARATCTSAPSRAT